MSDQLEGSKKLPPKAPRAGIRSREGVSGSAVVDSAARADSVSGEAEVAHSASTRNDVRAVVRESESPVHVTGEAIAEAPINGDDLLEILDASGSALPPIPQAASQRKGPTTVTAAFKATKGVLGAMADFVHQGPQKDGAVKPSLEHDSGVVLKSDQVQNRALRQEIKKMSSSTNTRTRLLALVLGHCLDIKEITDGLGVSEQLSPEVLYKIAVLIVRGQYEKGEPLSANIDGLVESAGRDLLRSVFSGKPSADVGKVAALTKQVLTEAIGLVELRDNTPISQAISGAITRETRKANNAIAALRKDKKDEAARETTTVEILAARDMLDVTSLIAGYKKAIAFLNQRYGKRVEEMLPSYEDLSALSKAYSGKLRQAGFGSLAEKKQAMANTVSGVLNESGTMKKVVQKCFQLEADYQKRAFTELAGLPRDVAANVEIVLEVLVQLIIEESKVVEAAYDALRVSKTPTVVSMLIGHDILGRENVAVPEAVGTLSAKAKPNQPASSSVVATPAVSDSARKPRRTNASTWAALAATLPVAFAGGYHGVKAALSSSATRPNSAVTATVRTPAPTPSSAVTTSSTLAAVREPPVSRTNETRETVAQEGPEYIAVATMTETGIRDALQTAEAQTKLRQWINADVATPYPDTVYPVARLINRLVSTMRRSEGVASWRATPLMGERGPRKIAVRFPVQLNPDGNNTFTVRLLRNDGTLVPGSAPVDVLISSAPSDIVATHLRAQPNWTPVQSPVNSNLIRTVPQ